MEIIPAIDIMNGKCVRLTKGDYTTQKIYHDDPVATAVAFEDKGMKRLHLVDLEGAKAGKVMNLEVLMRIAARTQLKIDFGGGVRSDEDIDHVFSVGASMVTAGSIVVRDRMLFEKWMKKYGGEKIILGADSKERKVAVSGWEEKTEISIDRFIGELKGSGIHYVICTDIGRDGMLAGPAVDLYRELTAGFPDIKFIASGGVSGIKDLEDLAKAGLWGAIIGKAIYENKISLDDLKTFMG